MTHISVLLNEAISGLQPRENEIIVDATLGGGGHSEKLCKETHGHSTIIAFDRDSDAIGRAKEKLKKSPCNIIYANENFRNIERVLDSHDIKSVDRVLFDLGFSSDQMEESGRGFSFLRDEPLIMTYEKSPLPGAITAYEILNNWDQVNLRDIIAGFGEERYAGSIARGIAEAREKKAIETTFELVNIIKKNTPFRYHRGRIHPATRTFQAIRIAVNDELRSLEEGLAGAFKRLSCEGRIAVIAFHSLEDRIVKRFFKQQFKDGLVLLPTKKPLRPTREEIQVNPRARSAKLRILERVCE